MARSQKALYAYSQIPRSENFERETGIRPYKWDIAEYGACEVGVGQVTESLGGPIDILVNNAGITRDVMFHKMTPAQWHEVMATNLTSCFNMCRAIIGSMRERGFGRIVNMSSTNRQKGQVGQVNYAAAKAGILGFTKALALESAAKGITVNAVAPGTPPPIWPPAFHPTCLRRSWHKFPPAGSDSPKISLPS